LLESVDTVELWVKPVMVEPVGVFSVELLVVPVLFEV